jgi:hypothetical protein
LLLSQDWEIVHLRFGIVARVKQKQGVPAARAAARPTYEQIAARAYQIYLERGCQTGHDVDDWLQAEYELMRLPMDELAKLHPGASVSLSPVARSIIHVVRSVLS